MNEKGFRNIRLVRESNYRSKLIITSSMAVVRESGRKWVEVNGEGGGGERGEGHTRR